MTLATTTIGVLALQGAFQEHSRVLSRLPGVQTREIRQVRDLSPDLDGLVIPGGESTVIGKLLVDLELFAPIRQAVTDGLPTFGTCAGLVLLARKVAENAAPCLGGLDITVQRNAYGRQLESFTTEGDFASLTAVPMVFIRAPAIIRVEPPVQVLARTGDQPVAVRQGAILATAFHPELTRDDRIHRYFIDMVRAARRWPAEETAAAE